MWRVGLILATPFLLITLLDYCSEIGLGRAFSFKLAGLGLIVFTSLRSCGSCAVSMAEDVRHNNVHLVRRLPGAGGTLGYLLTKAWVHCLPSLLEWGFFGLTCLSLALLQIPVFAWQPERYLLVGLCSQALFASLGLWIGAKIGEPEQACNNAKVAVVMILVGWTILERACPGPMLMFGALCWVFFVFRQSPRLASLMQLSIACAAAAVLISQTAFLGKPGFEQLSPLAAASNPQLTLGDCLLYLCVSALILVLNLRRLRRC